MSSFQIDQGMFKSNLTSMHMTWQCCARQDSCSRGKGVVEHVTLPGDMQVSHTEERASKKRRNAGEQPPQHLWLKSSGNQAMHAIKPDVDVGLLYTASYQKGWQIEMLDNQNQSHQSMEDSWFSCLCWQMQQTGTLDARASCIRE